MFSAYPINHTKVNEHRSSNEKTNMIVFPEDEEDTNEESNHYQRTKSTSNNPNDYHQQQRRHDYNNNNGYRQSPSHHQGQSSPFNSYHDRGFANRNRNGIYEQIILIRGNCVARIVGKFDCLSFFGQ